ncbi:MAG: nucleotidyltransferase [Chloroflexota bacterium]|nr:nucleotidyltransferase [Chloroflexota bacterium]
MRQQLEALREVKTFLEQHAIRHLVIGGIANAVWGRPRATREADFKVLIGERTINEFVTLIGAQFKFRVPDPSAFVRQTYVAPIYARNHIEVDLAIGFFPYEEQAIAKAIITEYSGVTFSVCAAEDLIIHKAISERERDWDDIAGVLARQGNKLDQVYIVHWLTQFAQALERPELVRRYEDLCEKVKGN